MQLAAREDRRLPLVQHLAELRRVLMISGGAWLLGTVAAFALNGWLLGVLLHPLREAVAGTNSVVGGAIFTGPTEGLTVPLKVAAAAGIVLALPVILWQVWSFVSPGLTRKERRVAAPVIGSGLVLFVAGAAFAYFVMPIGLRFLATFLGGNAVYFPDIGQYLSFFMLLILAFGIAFELPVAVLVLGLAHVVSSTMLRHHRRAIWIGIVFFALVATPGADPITPAALFVPLIALFELSVLILRRALHR